MSITSMSTRANMAQKLSIPQLQQAIQDGVIPPYVGVPLLQEKVKLAKSAQEQQAIQAAQQPNVAQQVMAEANQVEQGVPSLPSGLPEAMAGGGIVAFAEGGMYDEEDTDEDRLDAERKAEMESLMDEYAQTFQGGIGQLPAAGKMVSARAAKEEGIASGDAGDFVAKIMHKESRGRRYGRDGELLTSVKGAKGEMQVMPGTSRDPGYGVTPARNSSPDELARVGRDYAEALLSRYGDPKLAAIAYNMGPGATDKWLMAGADMSKLPKETQGYVRGFAQGGEVKHFADGGRASWEDELERLQDIYGGYEDKPNFWTYSSDRAAMEARKKAAEAPKLKTVSQVPAGGPDLLALDAQRRAAAQQASANEGLSQDAALNARIDKMLTPAAPAATTDTTPAVDPYAEFKDLFAKREANLAKQKEQDKYMALLSAGLGMMGGTSPYAMTNIGAGAQHGIQSLAQANAARTAEENALLSGRLGLAKIGSAKEQADAMMQLRKDLAGQTNERLKQAAAATLEEKQAARGLREKKELGDQIEAMRKDATTRMLAKMKGAFLPEQQAQIEAQALEELKSDPDYIALYKQLYGREPKRATMSAGAGAPPAAIQGIMDKYLKQ